MRLGIRVNSAVLEKAYRDISKLTKKVITDKNGHLKTVYVRLGLRTIIAKKNEKQAVEDGKINPSLYEGYTVDALKKELERKIPEADRVKLEKVIAGKLATEEDRKKEYEKNKALYNEKVKRVENVRNKLKNILEKRGYDVLSSDSNINIDTTEQIDYKKIIEKIEMESNKLNKKTDIENDLTNDGSGKNGRVSKNDILMANKHGLNNPNDYKSFHTPILEMARKIGAEKGVDLSNAPVVTGYRYGKAPESYISQNYRDELPEDGLSLAGLIGEEEISSSIFFKDRKKYLYNGILSGRGSDGEPIILCFDAENWGD